MPSKLSSNSIKVIVIEDHPTIAVLLGQYINQLDGFEVLGEYGCGDIAISRMHEEPADLVLVDIGLPGRSGLAIVADIRAKWRETKILIFSAQTNPVTISEALRLGISGFLEKSAPFEQLGAALQDVASGKIVFGSKAGEALRGLVHSRRALGNFAERELSILRLLADGRQVKEIAVEIGMSVPGVYKALERLRTKTGARSITELALLSVDSTV
jgi:DNA-binding NarL/FixJ family response regulator